MGVSYNRLWKLLIDEKMSIADLRKSAEIAPNTMTKLRRNESVNLAILGRICHVLGCDFGDIMEYVDENNPEIFDDMQVIYFFTQELAASN